MSMLRYKGVPDPGANKQVDDLPKLCLCRFVAVGERLDDSQCETHEHRKYACDVQGCTCSDYRPNKVKTSPGHWPRCVCTHIAQEHN